MAPLQQESSALFVTFESYSMIKTQFYSILFPRGFIKTKRPAILFSKFRSFVISQIIILKPLFLTIK